MLPDDWTTTAIVISETGRKVHVVSLRRKADKETWWWNEEMHEDIQRKSLAKTKWNTQGLKRVDKCTGRCSLR